MSRVIVHVSLLSGRYHAHPWGEAQHAIAGPEWPPSPWRFLRCLAAAWFDASPPPITEAQRDDLLQALGTASPPAMWLPPVSCAEIPYYQPLQESGDRRLHFGHFAVLGEGEGGACFCFDFDVDLSAGQQNVLARLLARLTYLGRAECRPARARCPSWCAVHLQPRRLSDPRRRRACDGDMSSADSFSALAVPDSIPGTTSLTSRSTRTDTVRAAPTNGGGDHGYNPPRDIDVWSGSAGQGHDRPRSSLPRRLMALDKKGCRLVRAGIRTSRRASSPCGSRRTLRTRAVRSGRR